MGGDYLRVGACSFAAIPGDTEGNIERMKKWIKKGANEKVELLLFPELSVSGYWTSSELYYEAQPKDDSSAIKELIDYLNELDTNMIISIGLAEQYGGTIYNTQILLSKNGEISYYRKTHWPHAEMGIWACGDQYRIAQIENFKVGTAICFDNSFPEVHRIYGLMGADLILSPYAYGTKFNPDDKNSIKLSISKWKNKEKMFLRAAAACNYLWIVAVVGGGHVKDYRSEMGQKDGQEYYFPGVILVISPDGTIVLESPDDTIEERLMWVDISRLNNMELRRGTNNFFKDRRISTYSRLLEKP